MNSRISSLTISILSLALFITTGAIEPKWHEGEGIVNLSHTTPEEARVEAFNLARRDALSQAQLEIVGYTAGSLTELSSNEDHQFYDHFTSFVRTFTKGMILEEETLFDGIEQQTIQGSTLKQTVYRVKIRALNAPEEGEPDPAFKLSVDLNQESFREGETLTLELKTTQDCYVTVFNMYACDSLRILFPHELAPYNTLMRGEPLIIPALDAVWDIPLHLLPGKETDVESVLIVATKDDIPFPTLNAATVEGAVAMDQALTSISNWLIEIPIDRRTEDMATYLIVKR